MGNPVSHYPTGLKGKQRFIWKALWPVRMYIRHFPYPRGKGVLVRNLIRPALPKDGSTFTATILHNLKVRLRFSEALGLSTLLHGSFELNEQRFLHQAAPTGATVFDIGGNIGLFTLVQAHAVGPKGNVITIEPLFENVVRMRENLRQNNLHNVTIIHAAVGKENGTTLLHLADDPAYTSTTGVIGAHATGQTIEITQLTLDTIWEQQGKPEVRTVKIDVEGGELNVLLGAEQLIEAHHPIFMIEINPGPDLVAIKNNLSRFGYRHHKPSGFEAWNHVFTCTPES